MKSMERAATASILEKGKLKKILLRKGFIASNYKPDFVLCYGGDGTVLYAERVFPGVPKLVVKTTKIVRKYDYKPLQLEKILEKVKKDELRIVKEPKICVQFNKKVLTALNEVQIRACNPVRALRFSVSAGNKRFKKLVGDGIIISTPFGSTGYYSSAGGRMFRKGIGIAFNNLHGNRIKPFVIPATQKVKVKVEREKAWLLIDNYEKFFELQPGDTVTVKTSKEVAKFIKVK
jgi:NAD+ kinase